MNSHPMHEANRRGWDALSAQWQAEIDARVDWRSIPDNIQLVLDDVELKYLGDASGRSVCVLGSGDNLVAFALAVAGARVTSVDISQTQLDIAAERAGELGLSIRFLRADVTDLGGLGELCGPRGQSEGGFDIVYTGGHVAVWVSDLKRYYGEGCRILKPGGLFMANEYHPFRRLWKHGPGPLEQAFHYFDHGPFTYDRSEDLTEGAGPPGEGAGPPGPPGPPGPLPSYEFHWTVSDMVRALLDGGCELLAMEEYGDGRQDWESGAPLEKMPSNLLLVGRKKRV